MSPETDKEEAMSVQSTILLQAKTEDVYLYPSGVRTMVRILEGDRGPVLLEAAPYLNDTLDVYLPMPDGSGWSPTDFNVREVNYDQSGKPVGLLADEVVYAEAWRKNDFLLLNQTAHCTFSPRTARTTEQILDYINAYLNERPWPPMPTGHEYD